MATSAGELLRLKEAKKRKAAEPQSNENPIKDGPNAALDALGVKQAQKLADKYGLDKLRKLFPDMAALLEK